ncbi:hypothetical protein NL676_035039 [Syzygium grande]|nr:hypothetical protein NL676_035039 [Syzygium grande]
MTPYGAGPAGGGGGSPAVLVSDGRLVVDHIMHNGAAGWQVVVVVENLEIKLHKIACTIAGFPEARLHARMGLRGHACLRAVTPQRATKSSLSSRFIIEMMGDPALSSSVMQNDVLRSIRSSMRFPS